MKKATQDTNLKALYDTVKGTLSDWESGIDKAERELGLLIGGDRHQAVYQSLRDVVFFTSACMDDMAVAAKLFGKEWEAAKPRANTNAYRHPIDFVISRSGVQRAEINGSDILCRWAKIAENVHPLINDGTVTKANFVDRICMRHGGIRGYYDKVTKRTKPNGNGGGGGKSLTGADANKKFTDDFNKLKAAQSNNRQLVAVILDMSDSKTYPNITRVKKIFKEMKETVACFEIDESIFQDIENA